MSMSMAGCLRTRTAAARAATALIALWGLTGWGPARSEPPASPDHWTLIESLTAGAARDMLSQLSFAAGTKVYLLPEADHAGNWLVERELARRLTEQGCIVIAEPRYDAAPAPAAPGAPAAGQPGAAPPPAAPPGQQPQQPAGSGGAQGGSEASGSGDDQRPEDPGAEGSAGAAASGDQGTAGEEQAAQAAEPAEPTEAERRQQQRHQQQQQQQPTAAATEAATVSATPPEDLLARLPAEGEVLLYRVVELDVSYPWIKRSWVIGPQRYGRQATVRVRASHLSEPGHRVTGVAQGDRVTIDEFPGWSRSYVEGTGYPFPIRQPEVKSLRRFIEPVFVVGVVGGLVYLFHENQK